MAGLMTSGTGKCPALSSAASGAVGNTLESNNTPRHASHSLADMTRICTRLTGTSALRADSVAGLVNAFIGLARPPKPAARVVEAPDNDKHLLSGSWRRSDS